jgi:MoxR-like ATPase
MTATTPVLTVPQKLHLLGNSARGVLFERDQHIDTAVVALVAQSHFCQIGPPGIAKTLLVDTLCKLIDDAPMFRWLMTRYTVPEELFGPFSLKGLENDEFYRKLDGKMVPSVIAFLDEIFKANSPILNSLLTLINEGLFFNGATVVESRPLIFCGSNELPYKDPELGALWDRITFRMEVGPVREKANKLKMLRAKAARTLVQQLEPVISWNEIKIAQADAAKVTVPDEVHEALLRLEDDLKKEGVEPTPRRLNDCIPIIQAAAYLDGRTTADVDDMSKLRHVLWMEPAQIPVVQRLVLALANPLDKTALDLMATMDQLGAEVDKILKESDNEITRKKKAIELNGKLDRLSKQFDALEVKVAKSPKRCEMVDTARERMSGLIDTLLGMLGVNPQ